MKNVTLYIGRYVWAVLGFLNALNEKNIFEYMNNIETKSKNIEVCPSKTTLQRKLIKKRKNGYIISLHV